MKSPVKIIFSLILVVTLLAGCAQPLFVGPGDPASPETAPPPAMDAPVANPEPADPTPVPVAEEAAPVTDPAMDVGSNVAGTWTGAIDVAGVNLEIIVTLAPADDGWTGTIDIPQQGAAGLPLHTIRVDGNALHFEMLEGPQTAVFDGELGEDGAISGVFAQAGMEGSFGLALAAEAEPVPYTNIEVTFEHDDITLAGTLSVPEGEGPFPAVVLISGSGAQDRTENVMGFEVFSTLADHLTRNGVAVLRYDDRGVGGSSAGSPDDTSLDFAEDALAGVEMLAQRGEIDAARIGLLGHSEGGIIAPMVAAWTDKVAFVILMAGPSVPGELILVEQTRLIYEAEGTTPDQIAQVLARQQQMLTAVRTGQGWDKLEADARAELQAAIDALPQAQRDQIPDVPAYIDSVVTAQMDAVRSPWYKFFVTYDPAPALEDLSVPVLALYGGKDLQVPAELNESALAAIMAESANLDVTVERFPLANHLFQTANTGSPNEYSQLDRSFVPGFLDTITQWIQAHS